MVTTMTNRAKKLYDELMGGDIDQGEFQLGLMTLMEECLVWPSQVESSDALDWDADASDLGVLWRLASREGYLGVDWRGVKASPPLARLFNAAMAQEVREAAGAGAPSSLHAAVAHSVALLRSNGVSFPLYGAPMALPNSDWLSDEALEWLRRRERSAAMKASIRASGGHMSLRSSAMDPRYLDEPMRSEVIGYLKAQGKWPKGNP